MTAAGSVCIRTATLDDLDILLRFESTYFGLDQFTRQQVRYLLTRANAITYVLEHNGEIVGSATMVWRKNSTTGRLYSIVVDKAAQGKGFAARLLKSCEDEAARRGCTRVSLEVRVDNRAAILLYERHGYVAEGTLLDYYADGSDGLKMTKEMTAAAGPT